MRIKSVWIDSYKNLNDFKIKFNESKIDYLIGKNGSGKSNFIESLIKIFLFLLKEEEECFSFEIEYTIEGQEIKISYVDGELKENNNVRAIIERSKLPEVILTYYSGHNKSHPEHIKKSILRYKTNNISSLVKSNDKPLRNLLGFTEEDYNILLLILIISEDEYLSEYLNVDFSTLRGKLILKDYKQAPSSIESSNAFKEEIIDKFTGRISRMFELALQGNKGETIDAPEGFMQGDTLKGNRYYITLRKEYMEQFIYERNKIDLFKCLNDLKIIGAIADLQINLQYIDGSDFNIKNLSDGEKQIFLLRSLTKLFDEKRSLVLLDEPDSFLHPEWQVKLFQGISLDFIRKNHIIVSTHNVATLLENNNAVNLFRDRAGNKVSDKVGKDYGIRELSSNYIVLNNNDPVLSVFQSIEKPILLTEGTTDPLILEEAWRKLKNTEIPFTPISAFSCEFLSRLMKDNRVHNEIKEKPLFGLFDFDKAYEDWNRILASGDLIEDDPFKGLCAQLKKKEKINNEEIITKLNVFAYLLPVIENEEIKKLVIANEETKETFKQDSRHSIELMFYKSFENFDQYEEYYEEVPCIGGSRFAFKEKRKTRFAKEIIKDFPREAFLAFEPLFSSIEEKITNL